MSKSESVQQTNETHESHKLRTIFAAFILDPAFKLTSFLFDL